LTVLELQKC